MGPATRRTLASAAFLTATSLCVNEASGSSVNATLGGSYTGDNAVRSNFYGISIEMSIVNTLVGETPSSIPPQLINYLSLLHNKSSNAPRVRIGGNSMDDSIYNPSQAQMISNLTNNSDSDDIPVSYGPVFYDVLASIASTLGGMEYLIGLSLINNGENNQTLVVHTAEERLGVNLDGLLLGNEPDLYAAHEKRASNYSEADYISEFANVTEQLNSSSYGNLISNPLLGGPTVCCNWDLTDLISQGYLSAVGSELKYLNLQHYPQDNCFGGHAYNLDYYVNHTNAQSLARWQSEGVAAAKTASKPILLGEFNSASCGGIPGISDTFAAALWAADYALQLATVGYSGVFIHTRERGVTYNLFDPPPPDNESTGWSTGSTFYSLLPIADALSASADNGSYIRDLGLQDDSGKNYSAGYGVYDASTGLPTALIVFNFADAGNTSASFNVPLSDGAERTHVLRTLAAPSLIESTNISWGGQTFKGVTNAEMIASGFANDAQIFCNGTCQFSVQSPGAAVLLLHQATLGSDTTSSSSWNLSLDLSSVYIWLFAFHFFCFFNFRRVGLN